MKNKFLYIILFSFSFSQFELDPRMLGMSGAYTSVASGYQAIGVNPANLVLNQSLSLNLLDEKIELIKLNILLINPTLSIPQYVFKFIGSSFIVVFHFLFIILPLRMIYSHIRYS